MYTSTHYAQHISGELHAPAALCLGKVSPVSIVGPRASLDALEVKNLFHLLGIQPLLHNHSACNLVTLPTQLYQP